MIKTLASCFSFYNFATISSYQGGYIHLGSYGGYQVEPTMILIFLAMCKSPPNPVNTSFELL
jgi:hypothetical protein